MEKRLLEQRSSAVTLSDMEVFIFPELIYSLVLANMMSPRIWRWLEDPWFANIGRLKPGRRLQRLRQYIMDHYVFNLDLDTWGMTTKSRELARFADFIDPAVLARSNALFGYEGDKYYFDIDIRTHFGLDKYTDDVIPYWKTETVEAMDAFRHRPGFATGAGECVSLAALYAAALFIVARIPLHDIFLMATPLHSQNFVDLDDGVIVNNRRLATKAMWFNGSAISGQARRALENERVTLVAHESGWIHVVYDRATIAPEAYERFSRRLRDFLRAELTPEILGNFLRQSPACQSCFVMRWPLHGVDHYVDMARVFAYEQGCKHRVTDGSRAKLMAEIDQAEFSLGHCPGKIVFNDVEDFIRAQPPDLDKPEDIARLKREVRCSCPKAGNAIDALVRFCRVRPRLPDPAGVTFVAAGEPLELTPGMTRQAVCERLAAIRDRNDTAQLAFHALRDLGSTEALPFLVAAMQRSPVVLKAAEGLTEEEAAARLAALPDESIYEGAGRLAQPDEVWTFQRGDGLERLLALAVVLRERRGDPRLTIAVEDGRAVLRDAGGKTLHAWPAAKRPRETVWKLDDIPLRGGH
jgi:hypothetical protein